MMKKKGFALLLTLAMALGLMVTGVGATETWTEPECATVNGEKMTLSAALAEAKTMTGDVTITLDNAADINLSGWTAQNIAGTNVLTIDGNGATITGLAQPLFYGTAGGSSHLTVKNLTFKDSAVTSVGTGDLDSVNDIGAGVISNFTNASGFIDVSNVKVIGGTIASQNYAGGLFGYVQLGWEEERPALIVENYEIKDVTITSSTGGSIGGVVGHQNNGVVDIRSSKIGNLTLNSTENAAYREDKTGVAIGTLLASHAYLDITETAVSKIGDNVLQKMVGRQYGSNSALNISGGEYFAKPDVTGTETPDSLTDIQLKDSATTANIIVGGKLIQDSTKDNKWVLAAAQIGETYYGSLAAAVNAAQDGQTVKAAVANSAMSGDGIVINKSVTIDLDGGSYEIIGNPVGSGSTKTNGFQLLQGHDVTIKNGTLKSHTGSGVKFLIQNYSNLTLDDVDLDGTQLDEPNDKSESYVLSNNNGTVKIQNGTTITAAAGDVAFDVCRFGSYNGATVEVLGEATTIDGEIKVWDAPDYAGEAKSILTLTGGKFEDATLTVDKLEYAEVTKGADVKIDAPANYVWINNKLEAQWVGDTTWYNDTATEFTLTTAEQLAGLAQLVNGGNNFAGKTVKLGADIDLGNKEWTPIGSASANPFAGTFDGKNYTDDENYTISNLKITSGSNFAGLFGCVGYNEGEGPVGTVKNVTIKNASVSGNWYTAAVVGAAQKAIVENCDVTGTINISGYAGVGGVVGNGIGTIKDCDVTGTINIVGTSYVACIAGNGYFTIDNCHVDGSGDKPSTVSATSYVGGIAGFTGEGTRTISNCSVKNISLTGVDTTGGIAGLAHYGVIILNSSVENVTVNTTGTDGTIGAIAGTVNGTAAQPTLLANNKMDNATVNGAAATAQTSGLTHAGAANDNYFIGSNVVLSDNNKVVSGDFTVYNKAIESSILDADSLSIAGENNTYSVIKATAKVTANGSSTNYTSLADAIAAATAGGETITLVQDATLTKNVNLTKSLTLELGGKKLTMANDVRIFVTGANTLTIQNGTVEGNRSLLLLAYQGATINLRKVTGVNHNTSDTSQFLQVGSAVDYTAGYSTITNSNITATGIAVQTLGKNIADASEGVTLVTITGSTLTAQQPISGNGNCKANVTIDTTTINTTGDNGIGIYWPGTGTLTIDNGTISGDTALYVKSGNVVINGGTFNATGAKVEYNYKGNGATATGDTIVVDNCAYPGGVPSVEIKGGTFTSVNGAQVGAYYGNTATEIASITKAANVAITAPEGYHWSDAGKLTKNAATVVIPGTEGEKDEVITGGTIQDVVDKVADQTATDNGTGDTEKPVEIELPKTEATTEKVTVGGTVEGEPAKEVEIPTATTTVTEAISAIANVGTGNQTNVNTNLSLVVTSSVATVTLDKAAIDVVQSNAGDNAGDVVLKVENTTATKPESTNESNTAKENAIVDAVAVYEINLTQGEGEDATPLFSKPNEGENKGTVTVKLPRKNVAHPVVYFVDDFGNKSRIAATILSEYIEFVTNHLSTYIVENDETPVDMYGTSMVLGNTLALNFHLEMADFDAAEVENDAYYAQITRSYADGRSDDVVKVDSSKWEVRTKDERYVVTYQNLAAKEMADKFEVVICKQDGTAVSAVHKDSARDYAKRALASENCEAIEKKLMVDMLNYGAAAQTYFDYSEDNLANSTLTEGELELGTADSVSTTNNRSDENTNYYATTLVLEDNIEMVLYFNNISADAKDDMYATVTYTDHYGDDQTVTIQGEDFVKRGSAYGVKLDTLVVADWKVMVTCTVYNADNSVFGAVTDSVESYLTRGLVGTKSDTERDLFNAAVKFCNSSYNYLHRNDTI